MKAILRDCAGRRRQWWCLQIAGTASPLEWSLCSTRREARELRDEFCGALSRPLNTMRVVRVTVEVKNHAENR